MNATRQIGFAQIPHATLTDLIVTTSDLRDRADACERRLCNEIIETFSRLDRSDPAQREEACDLAAFLYWHPLGISVRAIADGLGVSPNHLTSLRIVAPLEMTLSCKSCGASFSFAASSRSSRDKSPQTCPECVEDGKEISRIEQEKESKLWRARKARLEELKTMPYREYLKTPEWAERRRRHLGSARYRCQLCNTGNCGLEVHHRTYERRGAESYSDLIVLCGLCHSTFHERLNLDPSSYGKEARS